MQKNIFIGILAVAIVGGAVWYALRPQTPPPPPAQAPVAAAPEKPKDIALPPSAESDAQVRKELAGASSRPEWAKWLAESDLLNRWVTVADNLAEDVSPAKQLAFLAPAKKFHAIEKKKKITLDPKSYDRYDAVAQVIGSIDAKVFAGAVHTLHPLLEAAYHQLGYPDRKLDDLARKALQRLADAPVVDGAIELQPKGALYKFADDKLESLGPVEKHLVRMGPRNTKVIQAKAREIAAALDLRVSAR